MRSRGGADLGRGASAIDGRFAITLTYDPDAPGGDLARLTARNCAYTDEFSGDRVEGVTLSALLALPQATEAEAEARVVVTPITTALDRRLSADGPDALTPAAVERLHEAASRHLLPAGARLRDTVPAIAVDASAAEADAAAKAYGLVLAAVSAAGPVADVIDWLAAPPGTGVFDGATTEQLTAAAGAFELSGRNLSGTPATEALALLYSGGVFSAGQPSVAADVPAIETVLLIDTDRDVAAAFTDAEGDTLRFVAAGLPDGFTLTEEGRLEGHATMPVATPFLVTAFDGAGNARAARLSLSAVPERHEFTQGAAGSLPLAFTATYSVTRAGHGNRFGCAVSHFSYDDPILFPGQPGAAHLHMFTGNTSADAFSTKESLGAAERSSCVSGRNNLSSYWIPAFFNEAGEPQIPEFNFFYYKTFLRGQTPKTLPEGVIRPIPNGLQMLARPDTKGGHPDVAKWSVKESYLTFSDVVVISLTYPHCVAVDGNGEPVLDYRDMPGEAGTRVNSHVAYQTEPQSEVPNSCPASHPYRIPTLSMKSYYAVDPDSGWYMASDDKARTRLPETHPDHLPKGHSLHGDYFAFWDEDTIDTIVECVRIAANCGFEGKDADVLYDADANRIYRSTHALEPETNRQPLPDGMAQVRMTDAGHSGHGAHGGHDMHGNAHGGH